MPQLPAHNYTDEELLALYYKNSSNHYVQILLERYTLLLFGVCMKYLKNKPDASDAVQQVYLKTLTLLPKYKVVFFKSWLYMVAKNHCLTILKNAKTTIYKEVIDVPHQADCDEILFEQLKQHDNTLTLMHESIGELGNEQAKCLTLFYLQKQSYALIESQTGYSYLQIKSFIQNGKRKLKIILLQKMGQFKNG